MIVTLLLLAFLGLLMVSPLICLICMIIFDEPDPPCFEVPRFEELPQAAELKRSEIDYEHGRCVKDGVQIVTLWWLIDVDGLQMQVDGTTKRVGRKAEQERFAEMFTNIWEAQTRNYETVTDIAGNKTIYDAY